MVCVDTSLRKEEEAMLLSRLNALLTQYEHHVGIVSTSKLPALSQHGRLISVERTKHDCLMINVQIPKKGIVSFAQWERDSPEWAEVYMDEKSRQLSYSERGPLFTVTNFIPEHVE